MRYIFPHYFNDFCCVAAECQDTCCAGWKIMIDDTSLERYQNLKGEFGEQVRQNINWKKRSFCQHQGRCAFLNDDNLCEMHLVAGEGMLCDTCTNYPRHMEEYEGLREGSLSLSCIEAAKMILGCMEPVQFVSMEDDVQDEEYENFDFLLFTKLMDAREVLIRILQDRELDIYWRMAMALDITQQIQDAVDKTEYYRIDELLEELTKENLYLSYQNKLCAEKQGAHSYYSNVRKYLRVFRTLEVLKEDWPDYVKRAEWTLFGEGQGAYEEKKKRFHQSIEVDNYESWSSCLEQLVVYFVFVYFCGSVYDDWILSKMQFAIASVLIIRELIFAEWIQNGESLDFETIVDVAHRYSREVEHSDDNLIRMDIIMQQDRPFSVTQLTGMLLHDTEEKR